MLELLSFDVFASGYSIPILHLNDLSQLLVPIYQSRVFQPDITVAKKRIWVCLNDQSDAFSFR